PRYFTGRVLREAKQADYEVASMDDHTKFGEVFHRLSFAEAIDRDLLTDYQVAIIGVDDATYRDWAERGTLVTLDGKKNTDARSLAGQIGLAKAMKKFDLHRMITFHSRVKAAREFAASMPAVLDWMPPRQRPKGSLWSRYTSGEMSAGERSVLIQHLKRLDDGERGLLANARCLSEGVDVPALDSVAFIDPRRSEVDIVQAVGRAIRRSDTKTVGTIVIPVFIDTDQDAQVALDSSVFKPVWDVIKALRAHDTELGEQLDALRREMGRRGSKPKLPGKIHVDVPASVSKDFSDAFEAHLVDATTAPWEFWYGLLEKYIAEHGHARVYVSFVLDGLRLGGWARGQRSAYVNGTLSESRRLKLESLPGWTWDPLSAQWEQGFEETVLYAGEHGDAMVHPRHTTDSGFRLGGWVAIQRTTYLEGSMSDERKVRLESIPGWSWRPRLSKWEVGFNHAVEYAREFGDTLVPFKFDSSDGYPLGRWIAMTRRTRIAGKLSEERQARLEALPGWSWDAIADQWEAGFKMLEKYAADNGDAMVPKKFMVGEFRLGGWVEEQRTKNSKGKLSTDRKVRLEALPGWSWGRRDTLWDIGYRHALEFAKQTGGAPIPVDFVCKDGYRLGQWMVGQRGAYRQNRLSPERQAKVEALPGWSWNAFAEKWEEGFGYLQGYVAEFGNAKVPQSYRCPDGFRLGQWVAVQRRNNVTGSINAERQRRLEALPGWVWSTR
ncbi:MAG: Helicase associated domain protein, partial [Actinomycetota bacterium]